MARGPSKSRQGTRQPARTHQKVERLALRAVAPRRAAHRDGLECAFLPIRPPALRGLVRSQRDQTHHPVLWALRILMRLPWRCGASFLPGLLESVPEVSARLREANVKERKFEDVVKEAEKAAVLVLVY